MRIGITGTGGVGKSTLLNNMKNFFKERDLQVFTEITRELKNLSYPINEESNNYDKTQLLILGTHLHNLKTQNFISDRCMLDGLAYTEYLCYHGKVDVSVRDAFASAIEKSVLMYDAIFYIPVEFTLEGDGVRSENIHFRNWVDRYIREYIFKAQGSVQGDLFHTLTGTVEERSQKLKQFIINHE